MTWLSGNYFYFVSGNRGGDPRDTDQNSFDVANSGADVAGDTKKSLQPFFI